VAVVRREGRKGHPDRGERWKERLTSDYGDAFRVDGLSGIQGRNQGHEWLQ
jgi:hypothetical protein